MKWLLYILLTLINAALLLCNCKRCDSDQSMRDTIVDTIRIVQPMVRESTIVRQKNVYLHIVDTMVATDTIVDSVLVQVPIQQKVYSDTNYTAWVSGYEPSLDSLKIKQKTINNIVVSKKDNSQFSYGIQCGYGLTPRGFQPYIGFGLVLRF